MSTANKKKYAPKGKLSSATSRRVAVDIVTGKNVVSVYFDPSEAVDFESKDESWLGKYLYDPAVVVKDDGDILSVKLSNGEVYKINSKAAVKVTEQDDAGVDDILMVSEFSEKSLIHSLRTRYGRDDIYTLVGPILISINPYKWFKDLYDDNTMAQYHNRKEVLSKQAIE